jgi:predicted transcriptional regulator
MTPGTLRRMPNQPKTPIKCFRIPEDLYRAAQTVAAERDESLSHVIRQALERYVKRHGRSS